jgi:DNA invertase Pin-like site-specific DNA recombinase
MRIGYSRLASLESEAHSQADALKAAGCERVCSDVGVSAITVHKPGLEEALAAAHPGDTLVVCSLDRLARNLAHLIDLVAEFEAAGLGFVSLVEGIDTGAESDTFYEHMRALARFERNGVRDRLLAQKSAAPASTGRPPKIKDHEWAEMKLALLEPGATISSIAAEADVNRSLIYYRLAQEVSDASFAAYQAELAAGADRAEVIERLGLYRPAIEYRESRAPAAKLLEAA